MVRHSIIDPYDKASLKYCRHRGNMFLGVIYGCPAMDEYGRSGSPVNAIDYPAAKTAIKGMPVNRLSDARCCRLYAYGASGIPNNAFFHKAYAKQMHARRQTKADMPSLPIK